MTENNIIQKAIDKFPFFIERDGLYYSTFKELPLKMECSILSSNRTPNTNVTAIGMMPDANIFNIYFATINDVGKLNDFKYDFKIKIIYAKNEEIITCGFRAADGVLDNEFYFILMDNGIDITYIDDANNTLKEKLKRIWTIRNIIK